MTEALAQITAIKLAHSDSHKLLQRPPKKKKQKKNKTQIKPNKDYFPFDRTDRQTHTRQIVHLFILL